MTDAPDGDWTVDRTDDCQAFVRLQLIDDGEQGDKSKIVFLDPEESFNMAKALVTHGKQAQKFRDRHD